MNHFANNLSEQNSPYLLQHKNNPVWWQIWSKEVLDFAKKENKLLLISVGYSACHWCHVMEHESFEDEQVADLMNEHFVCIKVDREERPDLDAVYMNALHVMQKQGGWPLNVIALPNGKPLYGGTYFSKDTWISLLKNVVDLWRKEKDKATLYANDVTNALKQLDKVAPANAQEFLSQNDWDDAMQLIEQQFDANWGGLSRPPKFMMPILWNFVLRLSTQQNQNNAKNQIQTTLNRMAFGGIYDAIGGGFSRYSVDVYWKIPHFEKMLYDNAQLISLYAKSYQVFKNKEYQQIVEESIGFLREELYCPNKAYYAALDADSDGEEGKYYVWKQEELKQILQEDYDWFAKYYNVGAFGLWENGDNVLIRLESLQDFCNNNGLNLKEFKEQLLRCKNLLIEHRNKRNKPGLDNKIITSWNALLVTAFYDAYEAFGNHDFLNYANQALDFLLNQQLNQTQLKRNFTNGYSYTNAFLDDYSLLIQALIRSHQINANLQHLLLAKELVEHLNQSFLNQKTKFYSYKSNQDELLIAPTYELNDSVMPASNSTMAKNLHALGLIFGSTYWIEQSKAMLQSLQKQIADHPVSYANWLDLQLNFTQDYYELVIVGANAKSIAQEFHGHYMPHVLLAVCEQESNIPIFNNRFQDNQTLIYVCQNMHCQLPVKSTKEALQLLGFTD